jgi:hypothetical protein
MVCAAFVPRFLDFVHQCRQLLEYILLHHLQDPLEVEEEVYQCLLVVVEVHQGLLVVVLVSCF